MKAKPKSSSATGSSTHGPEPFLDKRMRDAQLRQLVELDPRLVIDGSLTEAGFLADDVDSSGLMRESCPHCHDSPLQLVIRRKNVIRSHLLCTKCTRCFDAILPDGSSAFALPGWSID